MCAVCSNGINGKLFFVASLRIHMFRMQVGQLANINLH